MYYEQTFSTWLNLNAKHLKEYRDENVWEDKSTHRLHPISWWYEQWKQIGQSTSSTTLFPPEELD